MRLWIHLIWRKRNQRQLTVAGPRENEKLEKLIADWNNDQSHVAYAWFLYVNADPRPYNLEPITHVDKFQSKAGKTYINTVEDTASITRFPLSAFLATSEGYMVEAQIRLAEYVELKKTGSRSPYLSEMAVVSECLKQQVHGLNQKWALLNAQ